VDLSGLSENIGPRQHSSNQSLWTQSTSLGVDTVGHDEIARVNRGSWLNSGQNVATIHTDGWIAGSVR
jgi:hypothetical protein